MTQAVPVVTVRTHEACPSEGRKERSLKSKSNDGSARCSLQRRQQQQSFQDGKSPRDERIEGDEAEK